MSLQLLLRTPMSVQWKREEVYDAVWTLRILAAFVVGTGCGIAQLEGFPVIIGFLVVSYLVSMAWLNHQGINTEEFDNEQSPLHMEGFQSSIPLFMLMWISLYSIMRSAA